MSSAPKDKTRKVLIANRGEIAIRIAYTLREMGIETVAVFTDADEHALHTRVANEAHAITSYLDIAEIIRAAKATGADAIHPGYGFLSENAALSAACEEADIVFIGPTPDTIRRMGDKLESKRVMEAAGVPVVPTWNGTPPDSEYPVLVKAVGGGGGKGMRLVERPADLSNAMASASREAAAAFNDDRVFVEKYIRRPRHIEFQILGDLELRQCFGGGLGGGRQFAGLVLVLSPGTHAEAQAQREEHDRPDLVSAHSSPHLVEKHESPAEGKL